MSIPTQLFRKQSKKKRGSLSRVKSTPKEEGGGDKSEPKTPSPTVTAVRTVQILHESKLADKKNLCVAQFIFKSINYH